MYMYIYIHTHTHTHIYIYIHIWCVCVCVHVYVTYVHRQQGINTRAHIDSLAARLHQGVEFITANKHTMSACVCGESVCMCVALVYVLCMCVRVL